MKRTLLVLGAILAAGAMGTANAARISSNVVLNTLNTFEDQSREVIVDVDNSGSLTVGDVFLGFLRLDDRTVPTNAPNIDDQELYAAFSLTVDTLVAVTVETSAGDIKVGAVTYKATATAGLQLTDVTGDAARDNTQIGAVYSDIGVDLIGTNLTAGQGNVLTQTNAVSAGDYEFSIGLGANSDDFFNTAGDGIFDLAQAGGLNSLLGLTSSFVLGPNSIAAGLTIADNESGVTFDEAVDTNGSGEGVTTHDLVISNGGLGGACDLYNNSDDAFCGNVGDPAPGSSNFLFGFTGNNEGLVNNSYNYYGLRNNLLVSVKPVGVPEPAGIALMGIGLLGMSLVAARRRRS